MQTDAFTNNQKNKSKTKINKILETKMKNNEKKYRMIFDSAPNPIFVIDKKGNYHDVNTKAEEISGYSKEEFMQLKLQDLVAPENKEKLKKSMNKLFKNGILKTEITILSKQEKK